MRKKTIGNQARLGENGLFFLFDGSPIAEGFPGGSLFPSKIPYVPMFHGALLLAICSCCYAQNGMRIAIIGIALNAAEFIKLLAFPMRRLFQNLKSPG